MTGRCARQCGGAGIMQIRNPHDASSAHGARFGSGQATWQDSHASQHHWSWQSAMALFDLAKQPREAAESVQALPPRLTDRAFRGTHDRDARTRQGEATGIRRLKMPGERSAADHLARGRCRWGCGSRWGFHGLPILGRWNRSNQRRSTTLTGKKRFSGQAAGEEWKPVLNPSEQIRNSLGAMALMLAPNQEN